jgi:dTDP-4-amino-4,6-dideoxygalactose transaminase
MERKIPYFSFEKVNSDIGDGLNKTFKSLINSKWYILGDQLEAFENSFAEYVNVKHAIGVGNGFDALRIALGALSLKADDEVILPGFTFIAIMDLSAEKEIYVMEDYAQAVGAGIDGYKTGSFGHINAASFYPTKTLGAFGDGGIITTNDRKLAEKCRSLRNYGFKDKKHHMLIGFNSRLDELQAAFLATKISFLDRWINERRKIAFKYVEKLSDISGLTLPVFAKNTSPAYHIFPIRIKKRNALKKYLEAEGIGTMIHYEIPPHLQPSMKYLGYKQNSFPITEEIVSTELSLPIYPGLTDTDINYIAERIINFMNS